MRALAAVSLVFAFALVALPVPAQVPTEAPTTVQVKAAPTDAAHAPGERFTTTLTVEYCYFVAGALAREPTTVTLEVVESPAWASARLDPTEFAFTMEPGAEGSRCAPPQNATLEIALASNAPPNEPANLRVRATAQPNPPAAASESEDSILVTAAGLENDAAQAGNATTTPPEGAQDTPFPPVVGVIGAVLGVAIAIAAPPRKK